MPAQFYESLLTAPAATAAGAALATSVTLTDISPLPQLTLPANYLYPGAVLRTSAYGLFSTTGTPTLLLGVYTGTSTGVSGVALAASGATTTGTGAASWPWRLELTTTIRTAGSSGTAMSQGILWLGTSLTAMSSIPIPATALATVTLDTTVARVISVGAQWGTSSASNTITCHGFYVESLA